MKKLALILSFLMIAVSAFSQKNEAEIIKLYPNSAPGSENWNWNESKFQTRNQTIIYNVSLPSLTVFKPEKSKSNGIGVILCPGGAFQFLSLTYEGSDVAEWLINKGFTVFLLKYRLARLFTDHPLRETATTMNDWEKYEKLIKPIIPLSIADGKAALKYVKQHAEEYGIEKNKIGIMGFSAGGLVSLGNAFEYTKESKPDFVVSIYPRTKEYDNTKVPEDAPPIFMAAAADDPFKHDQHITGIYNRWIDAGKSAEIHIYEKGGHGFGVKPDSFPASSWIERFTEWINNLK